MEKILIPLIGKRLNINGQIAYGRPSSGWKQRLYDKLVSSSFRKRHKNIQGFPLDKFREVLEDINQHYESENHAYVANVYSDEWNGVQIVHPYLNHDKIPGRTQDFGFSVYFTFDYTFEESKQKHQKFLAANFDGLDSFIHDEVVHCYDLNCGTDKDLVFSILKRYYLEILGLEKDTSFYFDASSHGKITSEGIVA